MFQQQRVKYHWLGWVLWGIVLLHGTQPGSGQEQMPRVGTLRIEGEGIERLVLQGDTGPRMVYHYRKPNLVLPAGSYRLEEIVLQGDYSSWGLQIPTPARVLKIAPGGLVTLKLGAPLRQIVKIERWGRSLVLSHQLLGQGSESYTVTQRQAAKPPAFVIHRGERQVASGDFVPG